MPKTMFSNRGILLQYDVVNDNYIIINGTSHKEIKNPLLAWREYIEKVDNMVTKQIGDMLEKQGKNRYTGLPDIKLKEMHK